MKTLDAFKYFGSKAKTAKALSLTKGAVSQWGDVVPFRAASKIHEMTKGAVKVDISLYVKTITANTIKGK